MSKMRLIPLDVSQDLSKMQSVLCASPTGNEGKKHYKRMNELHHVHNVFQESALKLKKIIEDPQIKSLNVVFEFAIVNQDHLVCAIIGEKNTLIAVTLHNNNVEVKVPCHNVLIKHTQQTSIESSFFDNDLTLTSQNMHDLRNEEKDNSKQSALSLEFIKKILLNNIASKLEEAISSSQIKSLQAKLEFTCQNGDHLICTILGADDKLLSDANSIELHHAGELNAYEI